MRINSTVALTLILLTLMTGAGIVSAAWGYALGREALRGITQPDMRPGGRAGNSEVPSNHRQGVVLLKEDEILERVKAQMRGEDSPSPSPNNKSNSEAAAPEADVEAAIATRPSGLPIKAQAEGVTFEVRSVRRLGDSFVMDVNVQNSGAQPIRFLYSLMNLTDDEGRSFSANTQGLPEEIPPGSNQYAGEVTVPINLLEGADRLSLSLANYPEAQVQLQLSGIPVVR